MKSAFGQMIIITGAVADILSIILFTFTAYILKYGFRLEILYIFFIFLVFYLFYRLGNRISYLALPLALTLESFQKE